MWTYVGTLGRYDPHMCAQDLLVNAFSSHRSLRLRNFDYTSSAAYFVTLCTHDRQGLFGDAADGGIRLNQLGEIVQEEWLRTAVVRPNVDLDAFVVMPNHIHGVIVFTLPVALTLHGGSVAGDARATRRVAPTTEDRPPMRPRGPAAGALAVHGGSAAANVGATRCVAPTTENRPRGPAPGALGAVVGQFKMIVSKRVNRLRRTPGAPVWQRNYYERIVRDEEELNRIRAYIHDNPLNWMFDRENPACVVRADAT